MKLRAYLTAHRTAAAGAGVAAIALLALVVKHYAGPASNSSTSGATTPGTANNTAATRGGVYDSTANDVYNSIQPQITDQAAQIAALNARLGDYTNALGSLPVNTPSPNTYRPDNVVTTTVGPDNTPITYIAPKSQPITRTSRGVRL